MLACRASRTLAHVDGERARPPHRVAAPTMSRFAGNELRRTARPRAPAGGFAASSASSPLTFASSAFCADTRKDLRRRDAERAPRRSRPGGRSRRRSAASDFELVPQAVDLVQDDDAAPPSARDRRRRDAAPDVEVGLGDAGVGGEDEQDGVRARQQVERELRLGADRVEPGRVEDDEALLQQRMREVDDRVAPARDVDAFVAAARQAIAGSESLVRAGRAPARARRARASPATRARSASLICRRRDRSSGNVAHSSA